MDIAINTDFLGGTRSPEARLKAIAEAGFTHLHWCHQWNTDFHYDESEIAQIKKWLEANAVEGEEVGVELDGIFQASVAVENGEKVFSLVPDGEIKKLIKDDAAIEV